MNMCSYFRTASNAVLNTLQQADEITLRKLKSKAIFTIQATGN